MLDIVTVVFEQELDILKVQAQSVDLYGHGLGIKNIFVIVNDHDCVARSVDVNWWGSLADRVQVVPRTQFGCEFVKNGWLSQQLLKLLGACLSHNTWSMILDAKTVLCRHITADVLTANSTQLRLGLYPVQRVFTTAAQIAGKFFGISVTHVAQPAGVPFVFNTAAVQQLITHCQTKSGMTFASWFQQQGMLTEFVLYTAWIQYNCQDLDQVYLGSNSAHLSHNICHSEVAQFDSRLQEAITGQPYTIGVHRQAWAQLSHVQKQSYQQYLQSRGLDTAVGLT